jgi:hypothetical protein
VMTLVISDNCSQIWVVVQFEIRETKMGLFWDCPGRHTLIERTFAVHNERARRAYLGLVGSRTGAALRRFSLAVAPRFLWECLISQTVSWFPAPAASNPSCRFPAMGLPVCFTVKGYETAFAGWAFGDDHGRRSR